MRFEATVEGRTLPVDVRPEGDGYLVVLDGRPLSVRVEESGRGFLSLLIDASSYEVGLDSQDGATTVHLPEDTVRVELLDATHASAGVARQAASGPARLFAPMPGRIVRVLVEPGQKVAAGQGLLVMEAMKMENELRASRAGTVKEVHAREGEAVETGALLAALE